MVKFIALLFSIMTTEKQIYLSVSQLPEYLKQEVLHYIEFLSHRQDEQTRLLTPSKKRVFGSAKGKYQLATDFDAPLEDFKDYMS